MISKYMTDVFCLFSHIKYVFIYQDFSIIMSLDKSKNCLAWNIPNNTMIKQASRNGYILRNTNVCTSKLKPVKIKQLNIL
jgi:hypothetical protein